MAGLAIELLVDLSLGVLNAVLAAVSFVGILWVVGGSLTVAGYSIPGYMVFACIIYSAITTLSMFLLSRPLVRRVEEKAAGEAQLRYELTRVKDNAENIAMIGGDEDERGRLDATFSDLVQRWLGVIVWQGRMMWLNGANLVLAPVVPLLLGAPKYLSGEMTLGSLMQAATAFVQVQLALNWLADNALRLADWFASSHRVTQLSDAIDRLEASLGPIGQGETIKLGASPDDRVYLRQLNIALHDGKLMIDGAEVTVSPGEKVLVKGELGTAEKARSFTRWPACGRGAAARSCGPKAPTSPSCRNGRIFRSARCAPRCSIPMPSKRCPDEKIRDILMRCGLEHLIPRIDETDQWSSLLSGGEQQRLAFARVLIHPPDILIMDEPTSSLDELSQFKMMEYMRDLLPDTMVIHAGHRPGLERFHDREIQLVREKRDEPAVTRRDPSSPLERVTGALQRLGRGRST